MDFFQNFRHPYYYNQNRYMNPNMYYNQQSREAEKQRQARLCKEEAEKKDKIEKQKEEARKKNEGDEPIFEILGIKLFFDDILIIALIFFLYNEGVKDDFLFISLILILLS